MKDAYLQIPFHFDYPKLTTANIPFCLYSCESFQLVRVFRLYFLLVINSAIQGLVSTLSYQDNKVVQTPNELVHDERLYSMPHSFCGFISAI